MAIWNVLRPLGICYGHLEYITAIWYILWPFGNFVAIWYIFNRFGILNKEISVDPASTGKTAPTTKAESCWT
jgi:hypothetical protein